MSTEKENCYTVSIENNTSVLFVSALKLLFCGGEFDPTVDVGDFFGSLQTDGWLAVLKDIGEDREVNEVHNKLSEELRAIHEKDGTDFDTFRKACSDAAHKLALMILLRYGGVYNLMDARDKTVAAAKKKMLNASKKSEDFSSLLDELQKQLDGTGFKDLFNVLKGEATPTAG